MSQELTYLPTKDEIFKRLFGSIGNEQIAKNFIEGILDINIQSVTLDHKLELPREHPRNKKMVADVIIKDEQGRKYILEMQCMREEAIEQGMKQGMKDC